VQAVVITHGALKSLARDILEARVNELHKCTGRFGRMQNELDVVGTPMALIH
jgi:hypothetical protein